MTRNTTATRNRAVHGHTMMFQAVAGSSTEHCTTNVCSINTTSLMRYLTIDPPTVKVYTEHCAISGCLSTPSSKHSLTTNPTTAEAFELDSQGHTDLPPAAARLKIQQDGPGGPAAGGKSG